MYNKINLIKYQIYGRSSLTNEKVHLYFLIIISCSCVLVSSLMANTLFAKQPEDGRTGRTDDRTDERADRKTDRQTDRQRDRQTDKILFHRTYFFSFASRNSWSYATLCMRRLKCNCNFLASCSMCEGTGLGNSVIGACSTTDVDSMLSAGFNTTPVNQISYFIS